MLQIIKPDAAHFGAKDWQQVTIIKRMVRDLDVPVEVIVEPTVREADGLALSSRNRYLSAEERTAAPMIHSALVAILFCASNGLRDPASLQETLQALLAAIPGARVDYARIVDADTLELVKNLDRPAVAAVAVFLGSTRLIDNISLL